MKLTTETRYRIIDLIKNIGSPLTRDHEKILAALEAKDLVSKLDTEDDAKAEHEFSGRMFLIRFPRDVFGGEGQIEFNYTVRKGWRE